MQSKIYKKHYYYQDGYFHKLTIVDTSRITLRSKNSRHHYYRHNELTERWHEILRIMEGPSATPIV
jgi:flagellar biosynthesis/type III secretory pathway chaperone